MVEINVLIAGDGYREASLECVVEIHFELGDALQCRQPVVQVVLFGKLIGRNFFALYFKEAGVKRQVFIFLGLVKNTSEILTTVSSVAQTWVNQNVLEFHKLIRIAVNVAGTGSVRVSYPKGGSFVFKLIIW